MISGQDSRDILFADLHDFFRLIGLRFVTAHGLENYRTVEEFLYLLLHMAREEESSQKKNVPAVVDELQMETKTDEDEEEDEAKSMCGCCGMTAFRRAVCVVIEE